MNSVELEHRVVVKLSYIYNLVQSNDILLISGFLH